VARTIVISAYGDMGNIRTSMNRGAFDFITKPIDFDDLRATMEKTLKYVHQIKQAFLASRENSVLKMYVNPSIVTNLKAPETGSGATGDDHPFSSKRVEGAVMFIDICGFTSLSEGQEPEHISTLLNTYFDEIARISLAFGGIIDKFIGDAAMIYFEGDEYLLRAVDAGLAVLQRVTEYFGKPLSGNATYPHVSIGLNCGEMVSGNFGSTSIRRLDYTVIGDTVNTAARLETIAGEGQFYVSERVHEQLNGIYTTKEVGEVQLKNKTNIVRVFEICVDPV
jgi:adenylate cyclase